MSFKDLVAGSLSRHLCLLVEPYAFVNGALLLLTTGFAHDSPEAEKSVLVLYGDGLWETHRTFIMIVGGAVFFQAVLITGLVVERLLRRRAEDRFRLVVEASPNGIVLVNKQGQIELVNAYAEKLFGYRREELIGQTMEILVPERFRAEHTAHRAQVLGAPLALQIGAGPELFGRR